MRQINDERQSRGLNIQLPKPERNEIDKPTIIISAITETFQGWKVSYQRITEHQSIEVTKAPVSSAEVITWVNESLFAYKSEAQLLQAYLESNS